MSEFETHEESGQSQGSGQGPLPGQQTPGGQHAPGGWGPSGPPPGGYWLHSQQWPGHPAPRHRRERRLPVLLGVVALALLMGIGSVAWGVTRQSNRGLTATVITDPSSVAAKVSPGLVDINTTLGFQGGRAAGTGMVLTSNGEVLTNNHVVEGATNISVTDIGNGQTYRASVVGYDRSQDIAVLQLTGASGLTTVTIGNSSRLAVGNQVLGIGNAGGVGGSPSVTKGAVTALDQSITATDRSAGNAEQLVGLIQVSANIQPGDSGGPLVDGAGQVVGIDTAASSPHQVVGGGGTDLGNGGQASVPQGFAIPINRALSLVQNIESGKASSTVHIGTTAMLGVSVRNPSLGDMAGGGGTTPAPGAAVVRVIPSGPAAQAGLVAGDVITSVGGQTVNSASALANVMAQHHPGDSVSVNWLDQAQVQHTATVQLTTGPVA
jgi:S1-C subfamily serine protease